MAGSLIQALVARLLYACSLLLAVLLLVFVATQWLPGSAAQALLGQSATAESVAALEHAMGLDLPVWQRMLQWLTQLLQGDFGRSYISNQPVWLELAPRLGNSLTLAGSVAIFAIPLSLGLALLSVRYQGSVLDRVLASFTRITVALPEFFTGYLLMLLLSVQLAWLPSSAIIHPGMGSAAFLEASVLPALVLTLAIAGHIAGMARAALVDTMGTPYIEMAQIKGLSRWRILLRHALPNTWGPIVNVVALNLAYLVVGAMVVEVIFVFPGVGQYMVDSVLKRDMPAIQACALVFGCIYIGLNTLADLIATAANPRLRAGTS